MRRRKPTVLNDEIQISSTYDFELDSQVSSYLLKRGNFEPQIINRAVVSTIGIQGINVLRTCRQIYKEASNVLYGSNTFVFDTRYQYPFTHHRGVHDHDKFDKTPQWIPGLAHANGTPQTRRQIEKGIDRMFDEDMPKRKFIYCDPLTKFFLTIGRANASKITEVKIEGHFKTAENHWQYRENRPIGFACLLSIHTAVFTNVCSDLKELALHQGTNDQLWDDDLDGTSGLTDEQHIGQVVGAVVNGLPTLKKLHLGNYHFTPSKQVEAQWGRSRRWMVLLRTVREIVVVLKPRKRNGRESVMR
jgi:hypothetical protein